MNKIIIICYGEKFDIDNRRKKQDFYCTNPVTAIMVDGGLIIKQTVSYH